MSKAAAFVGNVPMVPTPPVEQVIMFSLHLDETPRVSADLLNSLMEKKEPSLADYSGASLSVQRIVKELTTHYKCSEESTKSALRYMLLLASCSDQKKVISSLPGQASDEKHRAWYLTEMAWRLGFDSSYFTDYKTLSLPLQSVVESFADWTEERERLLRGEAFDAQIVQASIMQINEASKPIVVAAGLLVESCYRAESASQQERLKYVQVLNNWMETSSLI